MLELQGTQVLRQRTGVLFVLVLVGHLILISAQVQSRSGVPVLEAVTFGLFSRVQAGAGGASWTSAGTAGATTSRCGARERKTRR